MDDERDGVLIVGEVPVIRRRDRIVFETHEQAWRSGTEKALQEALAFVLAGLKATDAYEDTRPWSEMITYLQDRIRENGAT